MATPPRWQKIAGWLLKTKEGRRFVRWFIAKHGRELLGIVGTTIVDYVERWVLAGERRHAVVLEVHPDGFVQVYGKDISVVVVNRLDCDDRLKTTEEEYHRLGLRGKHRDIYGDARYLRAMANVQRVTIEQEHSRAMLPKRMKEEVAWRRVERVIEHPAGFMIKRAVLGMDWDTMPDAGIDRSSKTSPS